MKLSDWAILGGCLVVFVFSIILSGASLAGLAGGDSGYDLGDDNVVEAVEVVNEWDMDTTEEYVVDAVDVIDAEEDGWSVGDTYFIGDGPVEEKEPIKVSAPGASHDYSGMRGRYRVNMHFDFRNYTGTGSIKINGSSQRFELVIEEFNPDSYKIIILQLGGEFGDTITGKYVGVISPSGTKIEGWYTGLDGEQSQFTVELCDAP